MTDKSRLAMNDYLRRLRWALAPLPSRDREEIINELHVHFTERLASENTDFDAVAVGFGPPEDYARSFLDNYHITAALANGSTRSMATAAMRGMGRGIGAFLGSLGVFVLFAMAFVFAAIAMVKPFAPHTVGFWTGPGEMVLGITDRGTAHYTEHLGYWIIPLAVLAGGLLFLVARASLRAFLRAMRSK